MLALRQCQPDGLGDGRQFRVEPPFRLGPVRSEAPPYPLAGAISLPLFRAAIELGDYEFMPSLAGQNASLAHEEPGEELTRRIASEALAILGRRA